MADSNSDIYFDYGDYYLDFFTVYDMRGFFDETSKKKFESLIGTRNYSRFLKEILIKSGSDSFKLGPEMADTYIKNRIFTRRLINEYIFKDFCIKENVLKSIISGREKELKESEQTSNKSSSDKSSCPDEPFLNKSSKFNDYSKFLKDYTGKIQFSYNGSILVRLRFKPKTASLEEITRFISYFHRLDDLNQKICIDILIRFFEEYGCLIQEEYGITEDDGEYILIKEDLKLKKFKQDESFQNSQDKPRKDTSDKFFENLVHSHYFNLSTKGFKRSGKSISVHSIKYDDKYKNCKKQIMCYMRGTLKDEKCTNVKLDEYPHIPKNIDFVRDYDLSGQEDGLCLITSRKSLIVYDENSKGYWNGVIRAIELILCLKNDLTAMEYHLSFITEELPEILKEIDNIDKNKKLKDLENDIADVISTMQRMKLLLVPSIYVSSVSMIKKLEALIDSFRLKSMNKHIESNIQEINSILSDTFKIKLMNEVTGLMKTTDETQKIIMILTVILVIPLLESILIGWDPKNYVNWINLILIIFLFLYILYQARNWIIKKFSLVLKKR